MAEIVAPVFIIGGSRTGSEMLKTMLSASPQLDFVDELFLYCPRWLHKDLETNIREHIGSLDQPDARKQLIDLLFSGIPYGWFWQNVDQQLDREMFSDALADTNLTMHEIFSSIMSVHAKMNGKNGHGAKFPLHYSSVARLLEWFPDCKIVHTTRNPKAVYASQAAKYVKSDQPSTSRALLRFQHFVHINIQTTWTAMIHKKLAERENYCLVRYEDTVRNPRKQLRELCDFLEVPFLKEMLTPKQYGSSFNTIKGGKGVDQSSLDRYRHTTSKATQLMMDVMHFQAYQLLGYQS
jgi:hypothetical protein